MNRPLRLAECTWCISWVNVNISQNICHIISICSQRCWQTVSSRRGWFIVPSYPYISTKWGTEMYLRWNEYVYLMMWKYGFDNVRIRARWIAPYAWRNVRGAFRGQTWIFCGVFAILFQFASRVISRPLAAVWDRFIAPAYPYISTKWGTEKCVVIWIYVF